MSGLLSCRCGHPGAGCSCYDERRAEAGRRDKRPAPSADRPTPVEIPPHPTGLTREGDVVRDSETAPADWSTLPDYRTERERFTRLLNDLLDVYRPAGVLIWLHSPNRHLDGETPRELIASGTDDDWARLLNEADRMASR